MTDGLVAVNAALSILAMLIVPAYAFMYLAQWFTKEKK